MSTTLSTAAPLHKTVSQAEWRTARTELLAKEKELTRLSDELSRQRLELPQTRVEKKYSFVGPRGTAGLADLFGGCSQLAVYHFMFAPEWEEGCPGCSYLMDHMNGNLNHMRARDLSFVLVSRAPLEKLLKFEQRMGWRLPWYSAADSSFNRDFGVLFTKEEIAGDAKIYNYGSAAPSTEDFPGLSFFSKDSGGAIFHTYSTYGRGLESLIGTYAVLDRAPKGRDEGSLKAPMSWLRHHDKYEPTMQSGASCCHK